jgi:hypothetical protein
MKETEKKKKGLVLKPVDVKVLTSVGAAGGWTQRRSCND